MNSFLAFLILLALAGGFPGAGWSAESLALHARVKAVHQSGDSVYVDAGSWFQASVCRDGDVCVMPAARPRFARSSGRIPDGTIATASGSGIVQAWYSEPTERYRHGVLGDRIEAGALEAIDATGRHHTIRLGRHSVFEDLTPRIADVDGDGAAEVVTIRSRLDAGAAMAIYGLRHGSFTEIAATPPIGSPNRWLNIAGIADFTGDRHPDIALVKTPHIGGRLELWTLRSGSLMRLDAAEGFSNHVMGSTELGLSAIADADGDGVADLALPDRGRTSLRIVSVHGGAIRDLANIPTGGRITMAIGVVRAPGRPVFIVGLEDGRAVAIRPFPLH